MKPPYTFSLTGIATDKTTIGYCWPDKCDYKIPFSTPTLLCFNKGDIVTQVFESKYFKYQKHFQAKLPE